MVGSNDFLFFPCWKSFRHVVRKTVVYTVSIVHMTTYYQNVFPKVVTYKNIPQKVTNCFIVLQRTESSSSSLLCFSSVFYRSQDEIECRTSVMNYFYIFMISLAFSLQYMISCTSFNIVYICNLTDCFEQKCGRLCQKHILKSLVTLFWGYQNDEQRQLNFLN